MSNLRPADQRRKENFDARNERIRYKMNYYYHEKRIRFDDCLKKVADDFCLEISTIKKLLKKKSPA